MTVHEHLLMNHLIFANIGSTSTREALPRDHPIRRLMKPFNHKTPAVNFGAYLFLTLENCLLHRATSLTYNGLRNGMTINLFLFTFIIIIINFPQ